MFLHIIVHLAKKYFVIEVLGHHRAENLECDAPVAGRDVPVTIPLKENTKGATSL